MPILVADILESETGPGEPIEQQVDVGGFPGIIDVNLDRLFGKGRGDQHAEDRLATDAVHVSSAAVDFAFEHKGRHAVFLGRDHRDSEFLEGRNEVPRDLPQLTQRFIAGQDGPTRARRRDAGNEHQHGARVVDVDHVLRGPQFAGDALDLEHLRFDLLNLRSIQTHGFDGLVPVAADFRPANHGGSVRQRRQNQRAEGMRFRGRHGNVAANGAAAADFQVTHVPQG